MKVAEVFLLFFSRSYLFIIFVRDGEPWLLVNIHILYIWPRYFLLLFYPKISYLPFHCPQNNQNLRIKNWAYSTMHGICSASILFCPHKCCFLAQLICVPLSLYLPWFQCMVSLWTNSNNTCTALEALSFLEVSELWEAFSWFYWETLLVIQYCPLFIFCCNSNPMPRTMYIPQNFTGLFHKNFRII